MKRLRKPAGRLLGLCLALFLAVPALAAEPLSATQRQEDLDFLYEQVLAGQHPDPFAGTSQEQFLALKREIEKRLETESPEEFLLDLMRLTALAKDSHTSLSVGRAADFRAYPLSMIRRGESWYLSAAPSKYGKLLGQEVLDLAGEPVEKVAAAFGTLFSSDNPVYLRRQFRQGCGVADLYEYLGLVEPGEPLAVTLEGGQVLRLEPVRPADMGQSGIVRLSDRIKGRPETAAKDVYYFSKPLCDEIYYIQYNVCQEDKDLPMADFAAAVAKDLAEGNYSRVLLDLRNNGGGSDGVLWPLFEVLRKEMDAGTELVGLIGEATFSSALINAVEIQEMGGVLAGEPTSGSVCHFGAVKTFSLPNSQVPGQVSSKYLDLNTLLDAAAGRGVAALEPDVTVFQTLEDSLSGRDTLVEWLLRHPEELAQKPFPSAPLTRGRFLGLLYEAAGSPAVEIGEALPFADSFGIEWYLPAAAWAKEQGIARGGADGTLSAARPLTWREAAVFLGRTAEALGVRPNPSVKRTGPVPAALARGGSQDAVTRAWDLGLIPAGADFSQGLTRAQGEELAAGLKALLD